MERLVVVCWIALAAHVGSPGRILFKPVISETLYGIPPTGSTGVLVIHRSALLLGIGMVAMFAAWEPEARKVATLLVGLSVVSFLVFYSIAGAPEGGRLRTTALLDWLALLPLAVVTWNAWHAQRRG